MTEIILKPELFEKLNRIYDYFGGRLNKLQKLYEEAGEYRDRFFLNDKSIILKPDLVTEICDIGSCFLQLYLNEPLIREKFEAVINKTISKIEGGYYDRV